MFKLVVVIVLAALAIRYVPAVRHLIAAGLEHAAAALRRARVGHREIPRAQPHGATAVHRRREFAETELMQTRVVLASCPRPLLWVDGQTVALRDGMIVGRDPGCDIVIADSRVSRRHARVSVQRGSAKLEDLGSRNGIRVNGTDVVGLHTLAEGDRVCFGGAAAGRFAYDRQTRPVGAGRPMEGTPV